MRFCELFGLGGANPVDFLGIENKEAIARNFSVHHPARQCQNRGCPNIFCCRRTQPARQSFCVVLGLLNPVVVRSPRPLQIFSIKSDPEFLVSLLIHWFAAGFCFDDEDTTLPYQNVIDVESVKWNVVVNLKSQHNELRQFLIGLDVSAGAPAPGAAVPASPSSGSDSLIQR